MSEETVARYRTNDETAIGREHANMSFARNIIHGAMAGAAGTAMLNVASYGDMTLRGRPPSSLPADMAAKLATMLGVRALGKAPHDRSDTDRHRLTGAGALLGYADGLGAGALLGIVRPVLPDVPGAVVGVALGLATMVFSEGTATALGQTNPTRWGLNGWIEDLVPRFVYGWTTCAVIDQFRRIPDA